MAITRIFDCPSDKINVQDPCPLQREKTLSGTTTLEGSNCNFSLYMLADVLTKLNRLNRKFQEDHSDSTTIGATWEVTVSTLHIEALVSLGRAYLL